MTQPVLFRFPDDLIERLNAAAKADGARSRNSLAWSILDKALPHSAGVSSLAADSGASSPRPLPVDPGRRRHEQRPYPETATPPLVAAGAPGSGSTGSVEPGVHPHVAALQRQQAAKAEQDREHRQRRAEAVADTLAALKGIDH